MLNRFTERARKVLVLSQDEAAKLGHDYVGTEHLLLGLVAEGEGVAAKALAALNINLDSLRAQVESTIGRGSATDFESMGYTPRAKKAIELSLEEAAALGHSYIGTEHLLLGLIKEGEGVAAQVLKGMGANLVDVRQKVIELLGGYAMSGQAPQPKAGGGPTADRPTRTPALDEFGRDINKLAQEGKIDPVIGRETEIERVIQILSRRTKNNPVLIGEPGVGKTAIAEGPGPAHY